MLAGIALLAAAFVIGLFQFGRRQPPRGPAAALPDAAVSGEALERALDPRQMPFPADLPPERDEKLKRAIQLHLEALDAYGRKDEAAGNSQAAAAFRLYDEAGALIPELGQLHHELVVRAYQAGNQRGAVREAERWLKRFPDSIDHLETLGKAEYTAGNVALAADYLERAAALRPGSVGLWRRLSQVYSAQGRREDGLRAAGEALRRVGYPASGYWGHPQAEATVRVAVATYHRFNDYAGLLPIAEALLARFPGDPEGLVAAGVSRRQLGDYAGAEAHLRRVVDDPQNGEEVRYELGIAILKQNRPREAAAELALLLERNPYFSRGYFQLGQCLARLGRTGEADAFFLLSRSLAPSEREFLRETELRGIGKPAEARRARARALALRGQFRQAEAALRDPELAAHPGLAVYLVDFLVDTLRGREAEAALQSAARLLGPDHPDVRGWRARILALRGQAREAAAILTTLAAADLPSTPWARDLGLLHLEDLEDPRAAIPWLRRALSQPPQIDELALLGRALLDAGDAAAAREVLEPISRGEIKWEEEVRLPLALALWRSGAAPASQASELVAQAPKALHTTRVYQLARAEELSRSDLPADRERALSFAKEAERLRDLERRFRAARGQIAALPWPEAAAPLAAAARLRMEAGDRAGAIRLARLAAAAEPGSVEPNRLLADWLAEPAEVFYRLEALGRWRRAAPQDPEPARREEEARRAIDVRPRTGG